MSWELKKRIEGLNEYSYHHWVDGVRLGYLIYFSEKGLYLLGSDTLEELIHYSNLGGVLNYFIANNQIYISSGRSIYQLQIETNRAILVCTTKEDYITMLNGSYCLGRTVTRRPRRYKSSLIRIKENDAVYKWEDRSMPVCVTQSNFVIFENNSELLLKGFDIQQDKQVWSLQLSGNSIPRYYQYLSDDLFLVMQCYNTDHPIDKRYELWGVKTITGEVIYRLDVGGFNRFIMNDEQKLCGLNGQKYMCIDPVLGKILVSKVIKGLDNYWADIGNQSITGSDIFFIVFGKTIVGRFNLVSQNVEEFIEIDVDEINVNMTQPLGVPFYHSQKLYVRDNSGVMHIFQRINQKP